MLTISGDGCVNYLDLGNHSTMHMYQIITLYTLSIIQLFVSYTLIKRGVGEIKDHKSIT